MRAVRRVQSLIRPGWGRDSPIILLYHRVAHLACDPWKLAVAPAHFEQQIAALVARRQVVPMAWLAKELAAGKSAPGTAAVTFDDGYIDNLADAAPILRKYNCPATFFLTTGSIGVTGEFWWDRLSRIVLETATLPESLELEIGGRDYEWQIVSQLRSSRIARWRSRILHQKRLPVLDRNSLRRSLHRLLKPLDPGARDHHLDNLAAWAGGRKVLRPAYRSLTFDEVSRLCVPGFFDIGAHTVTHPSLPTLCSHRKQEEIVESRQACLGLTGAAIEGFAYPYGDVDRECASFVQSAGFTYACAIGRNVEAVRGDPFALPRIAVHNWAGAEFVRKLL